MSMKSITSIVALAAVAGLGASSARAQWTVTNLHPSSTGASNAYAASGGQQVGIITMPGGSPDANASLWSGTAGSWVNLHPAGLWQSQATAISGGQQVGFAADTDGQYHAGLWSGTAASWVDLNPATASESYAYGTNGTHQAGFVIVSTAPTARAALWNGTGTTGRWDSTCSAWMRWRR